MKLFLVDSPPVKRTVDLFLPDTLAGEGVPATARGPDSRGGKLMSGPETLCEMEPKLNELDLQKFKVSKDCQHYTN